MMRAAKYIGARLEREMWISGSNTLPLAVRRVALGKELLYIPAQNEYVPYNFPLERQSI
jgi:hypothetical protein